MLPSDELLAADLHDPGDDLPAGVLLRAADDLLHDDPGRAGGGAPAVGAAGWSASRSAGRSAGWSAGRGREPLAAPRAPDPGPARRRGEARRRSPGVGAAVRRAAHLGQLLPALTGLVQAGRARPDP